MSYDRLYCYNVLVNNVMKSMKVEYNYICEVE